MENRRLLLAALLSVTVLIAWNYMVMSLRPPEEPLPSLPPDVSEEVDRAADPPQESSGGVTALETPATESPAAEAAPLLDFPADTVAAVEESRRVIETDEFRAEFTNLGAQLVSLRLMKHRTADGEPLELVRPRGSDPYPFALVVSGKASHRLNNALFEVSEETEGGFQVLRFRHRSDRGTAEKVFRASPEGLLEVRITVAEASGWGVVFGPGLRDLKPGEAGGHLANRMASFRRSDGESEEFRPEKTEEDVFLAGSRLSWVTLEDNFFLSAILPRQGLADVLIRPILQRPEILADAPRFLPIGTEINEDVSRELLLLVEARGERIEFLTFFGAKQYRRLSAMPYGLEETVRWGFFGIFARPLYFALEWIHDRIYPNYGWAIVLVTLLIRLLFFPLTYKSQDSMAKMQELNPKIQAIKSKYRGKLKDRQGRPNLEAHKAMQEEQSALLREAGVNPAASCLPLLLQMPVFFAFFRLLSTAVELRNAAWIGWIQDLSTKDPYYILPILMGVTSVAMQKMMPSAADPIQRRVIQLMPIMFTFFALAFPSGLVLYWVTNNLLSMLQQALMLKLKKRKGEGTDQGKAKTS